MHANQIEEISELTQHDQLHAQQAVSSFQKIPIVQRKIQHQMIFHVKFTIKRTSKETLTLCSIFCCSSSVRRTPIPSSSCLSNTSTMS